MAKSNSIIIKKIKKGGHGHHGGAWKVAYADFVTAMMAFFLLLWLLNATTDAQKRGIADYFSPTLASKALTSGAGGVLGGRAMAKDGSMVSNTEPPSVSIDISAPPSGDDSDADPGEGKIPDPGEGHPMGQTAPDTQAAHPLPGDISSAADRRVFTQEDKDDLAKIGAPSDEPRKLTNAQFEKLKEMRENRQFKTVENQLHLALQSDAELKGLAENLIIERTADGLRIQLVDQDKSAMFPLGSTDPDEGARKLMGLVARAIEKLPNKVAITGHTDATPYHGNDYDNYDLSVDRARAMRHSLLASGLAPDRIATVEGKGATDPIEADNPTAAINRRVSIVLLSAIKPEAAAGTPPAAPPSDVTVSNGPPAAADATTPTTSPLSNQRP